MHVAPAKCGTRLVGGVVVSRCSVSVATFSLNFISKETAILIPHFRPVFHPYRVRKTLLLRLYVVSFIMIPEIIFENKEDIK